MAAPAARRSAGSGCGSGRSTARRSSVRCSSMGVDLLEVVRDPLVRDVPLAVVAGGHLGEALGTEERAAVEELLEPRAVRLGGGVDVQRDRQGGLAPVTRVLV